MLLQSDDGLDARPTSKPSGLARFTGRYRTTTTCTGVGVIRVCRMRSILPWRCFLHHVSSAIAVIVLAMKTTNTPVASEGTMLSRRGRATSRGRHEQIGRWGRAGSAMEAGERQNSRTREGGRSNNLIIKETAFSDTAATLSMESNRIICF